MKKKLLSVISCAVLMALPSAQAAVLQLSLTPSMALEPSTEHIYGLLLNISGDNPQTGLALGGINRSDGASGGVSLALLMNNANGSYSGVMMGMLNAGSNMTGAQLGLLNSAASDSAGVQLGAINFNIRGGGGGWGSGYTIFSGLQIGVFNAEKKMSGAQLGLFNLSDELNGLQLGGFNYSATVTGLQVGIFNRTKNLHGIQLGIVNWVETSGWFTETPNKLATVFPFVNWAF